MRRSISWVRTFGLMAGLFGLVTVVVADPPDKAPDWSKYATVGEVTGEVTKVNGDSFTVRVSWLQAQAMRMGRNGRPSGGGGTPKEMHQDYSLKFADEGLVRYRKLPPKTDDKGRKVDYTMKEMEELRKPSGVTGYAAERNELRVGHLVDVFVVRPKDVPADKAVLSDYRVKYAIIVGENPNAQQPKEAAPKKKNN